MKKYLFALLLLQCFCLGIKCQTHATDTICFKGKCNNGHYFKAPTISRRKHAPGNSTQVIEAKIHYPNEATQDFKDMVEKSVDAVNKTLRQYLPDGYFKLIINFDNSIDEDYRVSILYGSRANTDTLLCPLSLLRYEGQQIDNNDSVDAHITINHGNSWSSGLGLNGQTKNLTLALLRGTIQSMGFGSSIIKNNRGIISPSSTKYTIFDSFVCNSSGKKLTDIPITLNRTNTELNNFVKGSSGNLYFRRTNSSYRLYTPSIFNEYYSLRYYTISGSLMSYQYQSNKEISIDMRSLTPLRLLGWPLINPVTIPIECDELSDGDIASPFQTYTFSIDGTGHNVTDIHWYYELPLGNNDTEIVDSATTTIYTIPVIDDLTAYKSTEDGVVEGVITLHCMVDGHEYSQEFNINLDLLPHINDISSLIVTEDNNCDGYYELSGTANSSNNDYLYVNLVEEHNPLVMVHSESGEGNHNLCFNQVDFWGGVWLTLKAVNRYGEDVVVVEPDNPVPANSRRNVLASIISEDASDTEYIKVYDLKGQQVFEGRTMKEAFERIEKGNTYILKITGKDQTKSIKYLRL